MKTQVLVFLKLFSYSNMYSLGHEVRSHRILATGSGCSHCQVQGVWTLFPNKGSGCEFTCLKASESLPAHATATANCVRRMQAEGVCVKEDLAI